jgi:hypothetical protein
MSCMASHAWQISIGCQIVPIMCFLALPFAAVVIVLCNRQLMCRYYFDNANKPEIVSIGRQMTVLPIPVFGYNQRFRLAWTGRPGVTVTSVALAAPSATTHSYDMNQRIIKLRIVSSRSGTVTLLTPANSAVAPPQMYMIFALNGKTYGSSKWIKLAL